MLEVQYQPSTYQNWYKTFTKSIGPGGLCLISSEYLSVKTIIRLRFILPGSQATTSVSGEVLWSDFMIDKKLFESGIRFVRIDKNEKKSIDGYINHVLHSEPGTPEMAVKKDVSA